MPQRRNPYDYSGIKSQGIGELLSGQGGPLQPAAQSFDLGQQGFQTLQNWGTGMMGQVPPSALMGAAYGPYSMKGGPGGMRVPLQPGGSLPASGMQAAAPGLMPTSAIGKQIRKGIGGQGPGRGIGGRSGEMGVGGRTPDLTLSGAYTPNGAAGGLPSFGDLAGAAQGQGFPTPGYDALLGAATGQGGQQIPQNALMGAAGNFAPELQGYAAQAPGYMQEYAGAMGMGGDPNSLAAVEQTSLAQHTDALNTARQGALSRLQQAVASGQMTPAQAHAMEQQIHNQFDNQIGQARTQMALGARERRAQGAQTLIGNAMGLGQFQAGQGQQLFQNMMSMNEAERRKAQDEFANLMGLNQEQRAAMQQMFANQMGLAGFGNQMSQQDFQNLMAMAGMGANMTAQGAAGAANLAPQLIEPDSGGFGGFMAGAIPWALGQWAGGGFGGGGMFGGGGGGPSVNIGGGGSVPLPGLNAGAPGGGGQFLPMSPYGMYF